MTTPLTFKDLVAQILNIINLIIPAIFAIVFIFLVWKILDSWVINAADEKKREEGKQYAFVSVLVLTLMVIAWGVVTMLKTSIFGN